MLNASRRSFLVLVAGLMSFLFLIVLFERMNDQISAQKKLISHMDQQIISYRNDLHSSEAEMLTVGGQSGDDLLVVYNRVPKTGSTTFMGLAYDLCTKNHFNVIHLNTSKNAHVLPLSDQYAFAWNISTWKSKLPALYHGHIAYLNFAKFGVAKEPIYINLIRKPLDRLVSYYYFLRYGDDFRPYLVRKRQGNKMTFDECVERHEKDCDPSNMWLQIPFFCGQSATCWQVGSEWALAQAKRNLVSNYLLVGVTEQMEEFVTILERVLPRLFTGASELYREGTKSHLRKTSNKIDPLPETVTTIKGSRVWKMENDFYQFALQQFNFVKQKLGPDPHKQQFFFEKIRPRLSSPADQQSRQSSQLQSDERVA